MYRQATVTALQAGTTTKGDYLTAYGDVEEAFDAFLRRIGPRRGFVLLGHSQGTFHLQRLIRRRIDAEPALRRRLVSAVLLGGDVTVRKGSDRGGSFRHVPTCRQRDPARAACWRSARSARRRRRRRSSAAARAGSRSSWTCPRGGDLETACTNPAALGSDRSVPLTSIVPAAPFAPGTLIAAGISLLGLQWPAAPTTFVEADGAFTGACSREGGAHVLRIAPAPGTPLPKASPTADWGLHLVDANIALGELVQVVRRQIRGFS